MVFQKLSHAFIRFNLFIEFRNKFLHAFARLAVFVIARIPADFARVSRRKICLIDFQLRKPFVRVPFQHA